MIIFLLSQAAFAFEVEIVLRPRPMAEKRLDIQELGNRVEKLYKTLFDKKNDDLTRAAAAQALGNIQEFRKYPKETVGIKSNAVFALSNTLSSYPPYMVKIAIVDALGELGTLGPLGQDAENCLLERLKNFIPTDPSQEDILFRKKLMVTISRMRGCSDSFADELPHVLLQHIQNIQDNKLRIIALRTLGNITILKRRNTDYDNAFRILREIALLYRYYRYPELRPFSPRIQAEAIVQAARLLEVEMDDCGRDIKDRIPGYGGAVLRLYIPSLHYSEWRKNFLLLVNKKERRYARYQSVRIKAAYALNATVSSYFSVIDVVESQFGYYRDRYEIIGKRRELIDDIEDVLYGQDGSPSSEDTQMKVPLVRILAGIGQKDMVDTNKLFMLVFSDDLELAEEAAMAIARLDEPKTTAMLRGFYEARRENLHSPAIIPILGRVFRLYPEAGILRRDKIAIETQI